MSRLPNCYRCDSQPCECKDGITLYHADCRDVLPLLKPVGACVCDPPYELAFMGKQWDASGVAFSPQTWKAVQQALLPGAPLLAFGGTRTYHRLTCAIEDSGFEIRDCLMWVYGSGFPKSHDVSKAIDKAAGVERKVVGQAKRTGKEVGTYGAMAGDNLLTAPATPDAKLWDGWGTALKPAWEPIVIGMKPLDGTFAENALKHGVAGLNIDASRIGVGEGGDRDGEKTADKRYADCGSTDFTLTPGPRGGDAKGRFPANLIHDGSDEVVELFPETGASKTGARGGSNPNPMDWGNARSDGEVVKGHDDNGGSAARFFYCTKASGGDRGNLPAEELPLFGEEFDEFRNTHPTVKPLELMRYLLKLVAMPTDVGLLDPFAGSGTTGRACKDLGRKCIMVEIEEKYCEIAAERLRQEVRF